MDTFLPVHAITETLAGKYDVAASDRPSLLLSTYILTRCNTVSYLYRRGKRQAYTTAIKHLTDLLPLWTYGDPEKSLDVQEEVCLTTHPHRPLQAGGYHRNCTYHPSGEPVLPSAVSEAQRRGSSSRSYAVVLYARWMARSSSASWRLAMAPPCEGSGSESVRRFLILTFMAVGSRIPAHGQRPRLLCFLWTCATPPRPRSTAASSPSQPNPCSRTTNSGSRWRTSLVRTA
ncbi:hypothetical protein E1301_Tti017634 [Triplophysa tibetana]|uniref:Uncharacterized protein n=1 Tax=Triplophysa tibetana TaxID=1572043 RepID=A0A5A9NJQ1_9TELE|nr:hypothetical protein E1301_Tti017634 [Triplophysa tibetana]